jgi:hypothetical protein
MAYAEATPDARLKEPPSGPVWWIGEMLAKHPDIQPVLFEAKTWFDARAKAMRYFLTDRVVVRRQSQNAKLAVVVDTLKRTGIL